MPRKVPPETIITWTSQDTGRTLRTRKVATLLRAEIRRQVLKEPDFKEPEPPRSEVDYGDGTIRVANRAHPVYQDLLRDWNARVMQEVSDRIKLAALKLGVIVEPGEIDHAAVAERRAVVSGLDEYDDRHIYIAFVCIGSEDDWIDFLKHVLERSAPQEAAVEAHIATFQPDVQGASAVS